MILFSLPFLCTSVIRAQERVTKDRNQTIKVDVDLVLVNASVSDSQGRMVTGLRQENFRLWEDKVEQKVEYFSTEDSPVSIGLIFDATGSMQDKISRARDAAVSFLKTGNLDDEFFLVTFSQSPRLTDGFTTDISRLQRHMIFTPAKGLTPLYDAAYLGLETMRSARSKRKALLLITDGEDNHSRYSFSDIKEFVKEQDVQIFIIGIVNPSGELGSDLDGRAIIEDLAQISGGKRSSQTPPMSWKTSVTRSLSNSGTSTSSDTTPRTKPKTVSGARSGSRSIRPKDTRTSQSIVKAVITQKRWISNHECWKER
jgi:Ca-activated chloride channel homolog